MRITWTGLGFLGFMIPLSFWALAATFGGTTNFGASRVAFLLAAVATWLVGRKLNAEAQAHGDDAPHQAFGFPMQLSGPAISAAGFILTLL